MESTWPILLAVFIVSIFIASKYRRTSKADAHHDAVATLGEIDATSDPDLSEGQRRAKRISGRQPQPSQNLEIIAPVGRSRDMTTYWAAYEMIVCGLQVTLDMQEMYQETQGFTGGDGRVRRPTVASRVTYTTEAFIPHLGAIDAFEAFGRYAPFRSDRTMKLSVHPDDLTDAYALLREVGSTSASCTTPTNTDGKKKHKWMVGTDHQV